MKHNADDINNNYYYVDESTIAMQVMYFFGFLMLSGTVLLLLTLILKFFKFRLSLCCAWIQDYFSDLRTERRRKRNRKRKRKRRRRRKRQNGDGYTTNTQFKPNQTLKSNRDETSLMIESENILPEEEDNQRVINNTSRLSSRRPSLATSHYTNNENNLIRQTSHSNPQQQTKQYQSISSKRNLKSKKNRSRTSELMDPSKIQHWGSEEFLFEEEKSDLNRTPVWAFKTIGTLRKSISMSQQNLEMQTFDQNVNKTSQVTFEKRRSSIAVTATTGLINKSQPIDNYYRGLEIHRNNVNKTPFSKDYPDYKMENEIKSQTMPKNFSRRPEIVKIEREASNSNSLTESYIKRKTQLHYRRNALHQTLPRMFFQNHQMHKGQNHGQNHGQNRNRGPHYDNGQSRHLYGNDDFSQSYSRHRHPLRPRRAITNESNGYLLTQDGNNLKTALQKNKSSRGSIQEFRLWEKRFDRKKSKIELDASFGNGYDGQDYGGMDFGADNEDDYEAVYNDGDDY